MSEHSFTIVDIEVTLTDAPAVAARMLAWLQSEGIVGDGIRAGDIYRDWLQSFGGDLTSPLVSQNRIVYRPGPEVRKACDLQVRLELLKNWTIEGPKSDGGGGRAAI